MTMSKIVPKNPFLWNLEFPHFYPEVGGGARGDSKFPFWVQSHKEKQ